MNVNIGLAQMYPKIGNVAANLKTHLETIESAKAKGVDLLIFPELSLTGYNLQDLVYEVAMQPTIQDRTFRELLQASGRFAIGPPCPALADLTYAVGSESGREVDKFARHGFAWVPGPVLGLPLVAGCVAWLELRHIPEPHAEDAYDTVFGEVVSAQADERVFAAGRWSFRDDNAELHTLHHLGGGLFAVPSRIVRAATGGGAG